LNDRALALGIPLSVHLDLTYRCNERCVHCYLDHEDQGEMTTAEIKEVLDQLAEAGVFYLVFSGGEIFTRRDLFELAEYARSLMFCVKLKTNACMIDAQSADRLASLHPDSVQVSVYSHRPEVHDAITKLPHSLERSVAGIRLLRERGVKVILANVLMQQNLADYEGVKALAQELGAEYTVDPTVTPKMNGDRSAMRFGIRSDQLTELFSNSELSGDLKQDCTPPPAIDDAVLDELPCSAGHIACYVSPYGDVYPCVQFPLPTGNLRKQRFLEIWRHSPVMNEVRSIRLRDLSTCATCLHVGTCSRCPGLAYMEGDMRGASSADCQKSIARTGIRYGERCGEDAGPPSVKQAEPAAGAVS
jgi:radical SAM protein with 4Fe4S-binding SPASM domain